MVEFIQFEEGGTTAAGSRSIIGRGSTFNRETGLHEITITVTNAEPFSIDQTNYDQIDDSHDTAMLTTRKSTFPFHRLPPELRNKIFEQVLNQCSALTLKIHWRGSPPTIYNSTQLSMPNLSGLLSVNRLISSEATTSLYGIREFEFKDPNACLVFLRSIGRRNRSALRDIVVDCPGKTKVAEADEIFALLLDADNIQRVGFFANSKSFASPKKGLGSASGSSVLPFLRKHALLTGDVARTMNILQFYYPLHHYNYAAPTVNVQTQAERDFRAVLSNVLHSYLGHQQAAVAP